MFNTKTVKGTLKVLAQLIDWNELTLFEEVVQPCKEFVKVKGYRAGGMACLGAIVGKGMDPAQKLTVIKQVEFMEVLSTVQIQYADFSYEADSDDQDEEKAYLSAVSAAVCKVGKWCLQLYFNEDMMLPEQPEL